MMANFTTCAFSLPWQLTTATEISVELSASGVGGITVTAQAVAGSYYNNFDGVSGTTSSLLGHLLWQLQQAEAVAGSNGVWSIVEGANATDPQYRGRLSFQRAKGSPLDVVVNVTLTGGEVTLADLGSTFDPLAPFNGATNPASFVIENRGAGHWVLPAAGLLAGSEERQRSLQIATTSPDGATVRDVYGAVTRKQIDLLSLPGAAVYTHYVDDADFAAVIGCATGDHAACLDDLRRRWCLIDDSVYCRFYPDIDTPAVHVELRPGNEDEWMTSLQDAAQMISAGPLYFDAILTAYVV